MLYYYDCVKCKHFKVDQMGDIVHCYKTVRILTCSHGC